MVRVWNFVLPESGEHCFRIEGLANGGSGDRRAFLDNQEMEVGPGQETFAGPEGALLRIKECTDPSKTPVDKEAKWVLLVNERQVEEADASGNGLRDLRSMAEGSYTIATGFDAEGVFQNACRKYKFLVDGEPHEVTVAHRECVWQVSLDGKLIDQQSHSLGDNNGNVEMNVPTANGSHVPGRLSVTWVLKELKWSYCLCVGGVPVPASWTKAKGPAPHVVPPAISSGASVSDTADAQVTPGTGSGDADVVPESLPQGVSYDRETKTFQANIKDAKTKRYICLGEFASADTAHQKYLEALDRYAPEKQLAPQVPLLE
jgi:hypothetical protein